ncbi:FAD/NAD(P)-binding domain-containing protein [Coniochaeta ligniaria NRRL 30616]|uniref:FAD/NAD(P)-binding domain-containing protein n=1 Tax=Coniochaeta ligniaria NRRL 30616 TaxID=1408157 RepID=A0A1J7J091_9PEZI|nr:FAD/NAD(P)-binding domain-containing protein [Coniochaeta ligniaria NRRL 30616]
MATVNGTEGRHGTSIINGTKDTTANGIKPVDIVAPNYVHEPKPIRVIFIGAGISGIAFAYKANQIEKLTYTIYEKNHDVGGTWLESRYPGVSCDVPAHGYTYTWRANPDWSRFYAGGEEIWRWYKKLAGEYGVYERTRFKHKVVGAEWDEAAQLWKVEVENLETGKRFWDEAEVLINGGGPLNNWKWPDIDGLHDFQGDLLHTTKWDDSIKLEGKRVAVIGSGASGIQLVPVIQPIVSKLISFNRSPTWVAPEFAWQLAADSRDTIYTEEQRAEFRNNPEKLTEYRRDIEHGMNARFPSFYKHSEAQKIGRQFVAEGMRKRLNNDPVLTEKLIPKFELGCRRVTPGQGYLEALTSPNAEVVTAGIQKIVPSGIISNDGQLHEVDIIITATGYETSFVPRFPIVGLKGVNLQDKWTTEGAAAYLSVAVPDFPNYFLTIGPNAPISNGSLVAAMERQLDYALAFVRKIQTEDVTSAVVSDEAAAEFDEWKNEIMKGMTWSAPCTSWYKNGTADGKVIGPWPGSVNHFLEVMKQPLYEDFRYKYKTRNRFRFFGDGRAPAEAKGEPLGWYMQ